MATCVGPEFEPDTQGRLRLVLAGDPAEQAWPYPCAPAQNPLRVDPARGLWVPPPARAALVFAGGQTAAVNQAVPVAFNVVETASINIANPSTCYPAIVFRFVQVDVDFDLPPGADASAAARISGNEYLNITNPAPATGTQMNFTHYEFTQPFITGTIPAGGNATFSEDIEVGQGTGNARYRGARWTIRALVLAGLS